MADTTSTDIGSGVSSWLTDLQGIVTQAVQIKQQVSGSATSPVTVQTQAKPATGLSTGMIAVGVLALVVVAIVVKKVL